MNKELEQDYSLLRIQGLKTLNKFASICEKTGRSPMDIICKQGPGCPSCAAYISLVTVIEDNKKEEAKRYGRRS